MTHQTRRIVTARVSKGDMALIARRDVRSLAATLGLAAVCWALAIREMTGTEMGIRAERASIVAPSS